MIRDTKNELRKKFYAVRENMNPEDKQRYDRKITRTLMALMSYKSAESILCYASIGSEVCTAEIISETLKQNKSLALPVSHDDKTITFHYIESLGDLREGKYSIPEPSPENRRFINSDRSVCIIPGILFDKSGYRLGYGGGYYDRFLHHYKGIKIGISYDSLLVDSLPRGQYDVNVDIIVTEKGVYNINA